jgi:hypothetical protein
MKLPRALYPLLGLSIVLAVTSTGGCDPAPIDITGTWVAQPILIDSGWCHATWTFSADEHWEVIYSLSDDSLGSIIEQQERAFGLWMVGPTAEQPAEQSTSHTWRIAFMETGNERKLDLGLRPDQMWQPMAKGFAGWARNLAPKWPRSYALIRKTSTGTLEISIQNVKGTTPFQRLTCKNEP